MILCDLHLLILVTRSIDIQLVYIMEYIIRQEGQSMTRTPTSGETTEQIM